MRQTFITSLVDAGLIYDFNAYWHNSPWKQWRTNPTFGFIEDAGHAVGRKMLSLADRPTAIFAWQPSIARGVNRAALELGLKVPTDVSIMTDAIAATVTPFSTFIQPHRELAQGLLGRLAQLTDDPTEYFEDKLEKQFVDQGSIASPP
jgi:LacI family transcriptional regulator